MNKTRVSVSLEIAGIQIEDVTVQELKELYNTLRDIFTEEIQEQDCKVDNFEPMPYDRRDKRFYWKECRPEEYMRVPAYPYDVTCDTE